MAKHTKTYEIVITPHDIKLHVSFGLGDNPNKETIPLATARRDPIAGPIVDDLLEAVNRLTDHYVSRDSAPPSS